MTDNRTRVWIFLRGLIRERRHWEHFPVVFSRHFPADRILFYDYPGNGQRYSEQSAATIGEMTADLRRYIRRELAGDKTQESGSKVHVLAISMGGMVAVDWLSRYPDEVAAAALISTSFRGLSPIYQRLLPANYPLVIRSLLFRQDTRTNEQNNLRLVSSLVYDDAEQRRQLVERWVEYAAQYPVSRRNGLRQLLAASRYRLDPSQRVPDVPMLVLCGMADRMVSPQCSKVFAEHWGLPLRSHPSAGHDIPLDDADWVCERISEWLQQTKHQGDAKQAARPPVP